MTPSVWQRIKRRLSLMGGSYKHPDGYIELDFEAAAGIERGDSDTIKDLKLARHHARQRKWDKARGAILVGVAAGYCLAAYAGVSTVEAIGIAALISYGLFLLAQ